MSKVYYADLSDRTGTVIKTIEVSVTAFDHGALAELCGQIDEFLETTEGPAVYWVEYYVQTPERGSVLLAGEKV
jgi:hypothetical protein